MRSCKVNFWQKCMQVCVGMSRKARSIKQDILRSCEGDTPSYQTRRLESDNQIVTSPNCSATSFTFRSSSAEPPLFPAAAAKLIVERMLAAGPCVERGEGGRETSPRCTGVRGTPLRSAPWRELLRDIGWPVRSLVASRSLSRRSVMVFSLAVTSTGLDYNRSISARKPTRPRDTNLAAPKGLGRLAGVLWDILGEASGDGVDEAVPVRGRSSNFRRVS